MYSKTIQIVGWWRCRAVNMEETIEDGLGAP